MRIFKSVGFIHYGVLVTVLLGGILAYNLLLGDRQLFVPGETTHGHHQIEMACSTCHVKAFTGSEPMQNACVACHGDALDKARDTHPKKKFTDPRNADLLANLDATQCVTCHIEHSPEVTGDFGLTLPEDFCFYCHRDIAEERPSHSEFAFDSCSNSGCHNYHDNKALYEQYLAKHVGQPSLLNDAKVRIPNAISLWLKSNSDSQPLAQHQNDGHTIKGLLGTAIQAPDSSAKVVQQWATSAHATAQVNCSDCHAETDTSRTKNEAPLVTHTELAHTGNLNGLATCKSCHEKQTLGFKSGLHGMRQAIDLPAMQVAQARLPMQKNASHRELNCSSCHDPHKPDLVEAAVTSCLTCHNDEHSNNFDKSKHYQAWLAEQSGQGAAGSGVSCATCHMPRIKKGKRVHVEHNQSLTLEPNSKMIRPVCQQCHGLEFSIAALADRNLINSNFTRDFEPRHQSFDLVKARQAAKRAGKKKPSAD
ncbi:ammonia-forming cytochrome c nitrite reductase subunit c552 [Arenicella xantha]|uniref:nitrite reductase (cytochrome; ammonia-forming) n=1 Tax=Arenicella xantha TaxID=644221 RepID=A0A395JL76_9GAMM|nr:ammonia-forming cytochrome c nitrite reductase subunit c552 [Arenicella xantha]RBP51349.1 cytochrome c552 [Arenicella xantha]